MTEEMRRRAREMMDASSDAGFGEAAPPVPLASVPQPDPAAIDRETGGRIVSATFMSRSGNERPHVVTAGIDDTVWCTCRASVPCWAAKAFRRVTGRA